MTGLAMALVALLAPLPFALTLCEEAEHVGLAISAVFWFLAIVQWIRQIWADRKVKRNSEPAIRSDS